MFFRRGEIVSVDGGEKRWCVEQITEEYDKDGEMTSVAHLVDERQGTRTANVDRLTKVGG
jgi:hypothetical protein